MTHDVNWARYAASHANTGQSVATGQPTLGVGSYRCEGCGRPHIVIAAIDEQGFEVNVSLPPALAHQVADMIHSHARTAVN